MSTYPMLTRRAFHATALSTLACGQGAAAETEETPSEPLPLDLLPPAIAVLKSRRDEAKPITPAERERRIERARQLMAENKLDAICLAGGTSLRYFTGMHWWNSEWLFLIVLPHEAAPFYICPAFEGDRAHEQIEKAPDSARSKVWLWQEDEDPYAIAASAMREAGLASGAIGMEERIPFVFVSGIARLLPSAHIVSATPVTAGCRSIKSPAEIALMRLANHVTLEAYQAVWRSAQPGMTQHQMEQFLAAAFRQLGFPGEASVQVGVNTALPHGSAAPQIIREREMILIDDGCSVEGYESDISRSFVIGPPTDKMKRVFELVHRAQTAVLQAARPGLACGQLDTVARTVIAAGKFGAGYEHFAHRVGHGIGMDGHEWPYLVRGNPLPLAAGMTFSDEPGIYIRGEFGIRLEDDLHILGDGAELFTPQSPSLELPFASS